MLDHADFIARYDKHDTLGIIDRLPEQLKHDFARPDISGLIGVKLIVLAGMGGSALAAEFIKHWLADSLTVPFIIVRDYDLPAIVGPETLVIASSYSGNTEETISALAQAEAKGAKILVTAAGGKLIATAKAKSYPYYELPTGLQPRMAVLYGVRWIADLLEALGLAEGLGQALVAAAQGVESHMAGWKAGVPTADNVAKQIAGDLVGHSVVVYAGPNLAFGAMKWKIGLNENAKNIAFYNYVSEMNHNEFIGWSHPERSGLKVVELRSQLENDRINKRFDIMNRLLSSSFAPIEVNAIGETKLEQLVWAIVLGEYVATYLAFLNGIDPFPVDLVEELKRELEA